MAWKPADEASHFAKLGQWCLDNQLFAEGAEAIESALALGDTSRTTHMLQVKAYALEAYPDDLRTIYVAADNFRVAKLDASTMPLRVAAATRAAELALEYLRANSTFQPGPQWNPEDPVDLSVKTLNTTLRILCAAYESDYLDRHPDDLAALRHAIQPLIADLAARLTPMPPSLVRGAFLHYRAYYAGIWNDKPEEALALYREILKGGEVDGAWAREQLFAPAQRQPYLDLPDGVPQPVAPSWIRMTAPWIVAWDGRTPDETKHLWQSFVQQLASSPNLLDQCDAMKFEVCSDQTEAARDAVGVRFVGFLQNHPEILSGPQKEEFCEGAQALLGTLGQKATEDLRPALIQFVANLMHRHVPLTAGWIGDMTDFVYGPHADDSTPKLLAALNDYSAWCGKQNPRDGEVVRALDQLRAIIFRAKPELVPSTAPPDHPLTISKFWKLDHPPDVRNGDARTLIDPRTLAVQGQTAWVLAMLRPGKIVSFDTSTMQTVQTVDLPTDLVSRQHTSRAHHRYLEVTPDWIALGAESMAMLYSRSSGQWIKLDVPPSCYKPRWTGGHLYLLYDAERGGRISPVFADDPVAAGSGVIGVLLPGGACQVLISSRRVPPQNALDGQLLSEPIDIWTSATGTSLSFYGQPVYSCPTGKNDWTPLPGTPPIRRGKVTSSGFLTEENFTGGHYGKLVLHGEGPARVLLSDEGAAEWNFPKDSGFDMEHAMLFSCPIIRGHDLCIFANLKAGPAVGEQPYLIYFAEGRKEGLPIPLSFDYTEVSDPALVKARPLATAYEALAPTDAGVMIPEPNLRGFWLLPWSDIDAWRAKSMASVTVRPVEVTK